MADETVWVNASVDPETRSRAEKMASADERSISALVRVLINREWDRRQRSVSAETALEVTDERK
jgi:hypothetical protein